MIETEQTFNPNVRNFYFPKPLLEKDRILYFDQMTKDSKLMNTLSRFGVVRMLITDNIVFVEKDNAADFGHLEGLIMAFVSDADLHLEPDDASLIKKVDAIVESQVRPFLQKDGGNIEVLEVKDGTVYVRLQGRCQGCAYANQTLQNVVEKIIKKYVIEIKGVQKEE